MARTDLESIERSPSSTNTTSTRTRIQNTTPQLGRRQYLKMVGATGIAAALAGCAALNQEFNSTPLGWTNEDFNVFNRVVEKTTEGTQSGVSYSATSYTTIFDVPSVEGSLVAASFPFVSLLGQDVTGLDKMSISEVVNGDRGLSLFNDLAIVDKRVTSIRPSRTTGADGQRTSNAYVKSLIKWERYDIKATDVDGDTYETIVDISKGRTKEFGTGTEDVTFTALGGQVRPSVSRQQLDNTIDNNHNRLIRTLDQLSNTDIEY